MSENKEYIKDMKGEVHIADDVVAIIAGIAATEVEGVASMSGDITNEIISKLGVKNLAKGVKVDISSKVQERVKVAIENMTGFNVIEVNIKIAGVSTN